MAGMALLAGALAAAPTAPVSQAPVAPPSEAAAVPAGPADLAGARDLWDAQWHDRDGTVRTGVTGDGVSIFSAQPYDTLHPDLDHCDDGVHHALIVSDNGNNLVGPTPFPKGDSTHGEFIAGVLCGDGTNSGGRYAGVAPDSTVFARINGCLASCDLSPWFDEPSLRVFTWSTSHDYHAEAFEYGYTEDDDLLFVAAVGNTGGDGTTATTAEFLHDDDEVLGVAGAVATLDAVSDASSRGARNRPWTWPDITAPSCMFGVTPMPGAHYYAVSVLAFMAVNSGCPDVETATLAEGFAAGYTLNAGTSFASPIVAATAALVAEMNPDLSAAELRYLLTRTASPFLESEDLDGDGQVSPEEFRQQHGWEAGWGLVDPEAAVAAAHWALLHPTGSMQDAVDCSTTDVVGGTLVLNPEGGSC